MLTGMPAAALDEAWPVLEPFVERMLRKVREHRWDAADIREMIAERELQVWLKIKDKQVVGVILTQILNFPRARECNVFMTSGELLEDWSESQDILLAWAAEQGCHYISALARKGVAKTVGWDERTIYIARAI